MRVACSHRTGPTTFSFTNNTFISVNGLFYYHIGGILLSSTIKQQLQKVEQLHFHGEYQEALKLIEEGFKTKNISKEEKLAFLILKSTIHFDLGELKEALEIAEKVLGESGETDNVLLHIDALIQKGMVIFNLYEKIDESANSLDKANELLETTKLVIPEKDFSKRKALLFLVKANLLSVSGNRKESHKLFEESVSFARKSGNKRILAWVLLWTGFVTTNKNYAEEAHEISIEIGNKFLLACSYFSLAVNAGYKYDYYEAIELYIKGFSLLDEVGSTFHREGSYNNLGVCYHNTYQLDKALECYQRALKGSSIQSYVMLSNIGYVYLLDNKLEEAKDYYLKALQNCEEVKGYLYLASYFYQLIFISLELNEFTQAQMYLDRLEQLSKEISLEKFSLKAYLASILILKASGDISDLGEAVKLLKEILTKENLDPGSRLEALYSLLEIRIKELQISATKESLIEVKKQAIRLEVEAEERQYKWLLGNVYRLQSQLALIEIDADTAIDLLKKAENIAIENKNEFLKEKITEDHEKINQQLGLLQQLQERKAPLSETVKLASLENTIQKIKKETVLEERDEETGKIIEYRKLFALKI